MNGWKLTPVVAGIFVLVAFVVSPGQVRAASCLHGLEGRRVVVVIHGGRVIRGWLIRAGPGKLLVGRDNNTFARIDVRIVSKVSQRSSVDRSRGPGVRVVECFPNAIKLSPRARPKPSAARANAMKRVAKVDRLRKIGMGLTIAGLSVGVVGTGVLFTGVALFWGSLWIGGLATAIVGAVMTASGTPIWIVGAMRAKKARKHLEQYPTDRRLLDPEPEGRRFSNLSSQLPLATVLSW